MPRGFSAYETASIQGNLWEPNPADWLSWYDFSRHTTIGVDSVGVTTLQSISGSRNLSQADSANKPSIITLPEGIRACNFGTTGQLTTPDTWPSGAKTFISATKLNELPSAASFTIMSVKSGTNWAEFGVTNQIGGCRYFSSNFSSSHATRSISPPLTLDREIFAWTYNGGSHTANASYSARLQGATVAVAIGITSLRSSQADPSSLSGRAPGPAIPWRGQIYEVFAASGVLDVASIARVEGYLAWKWGIKLDSEHPFATRPPLLIG
jgi:hypothetical protein